MGTIKRTYKLDEAVLADAVALAEKKGTSVTAIIENAIRCYKDYTYMETAAFVPDQFVRQVNASLRLLEKRQNAKTNQVLSELAIQEYSQIQAKGKSCYNMQRRTTVSLRKNFWKDIICTELSRLCKQ